MKTTICGLAVLLSACAAPVSQPDRPAAVRPATAEDVAKCQYVDDITGTSGWYGMFAAQGIDNAKSEALARAQATGATHIVWADQKPVYGSTVITGKAYRCEMPAATKN